MNIIIIKTDGTREETFWDVSDEALDFFMSGSNDFDPGKRPGECPDAIFQRMWKRETHSDGTCVCGTDTADCREFAGCPTECADCPKFTPCLTRDEDIAYEVHEKDFEPYQELSAAWDAWDSFVAENGAPEYGCDVEFWDAESILSWIASHSN